MGTSPVQRPRLPAPFPYIGGKSRIAARVWEALGNPSVYIEPFFGSGAVLLARPQPPKVETVNDADGFLTCFWRAIQHDPEGVAQWADAPVNELDLYARHAWLMQQEAFIERMRRDPEYYDIQIAGWWVWGASCWIGHGWCHPNKLSKQVPMISGGHWGRGVHQKRPSVPGDRQGNGVHQGDRAREGVYAFPKQRPHLTDHGQGVCARQGADLVTWFGALSERLRRVRVCCGDWQRVCTPVVLNGAGYTGIFFDPPYSQTERAPHLYAHDTPRVAQDVAAWCREHGDNPRYRIVLCGYEGNYELPGWRIMRWQAPGGYANQGTGRGKQNRTRECLWLSPHCVEPQLALW